MEKKLLIHVAQKERWEVAAVNAINFLKAGQEGDTLRVRLVANADSVTRVCSCEPELFEKLRQVVLDGGEIYLCENAMAKFGVKKEGLADIFKTVPAGIMALVDMQAEGWIYVRP